MASQQRRPGPAAPAGRRLAWRSDPPPAPKPDLRDQLALRIGWVRFWLRALALGLGIALTGSSLALWPQIKGQGPYILFFVGLCIVPVGGLLALLSWLVPLPHEHVVACPYCATPTRVLSLPRRLPYTCRHCRKQGTIERGRITLESDRRG